MRSVLLIITGSIAAYKSLELIRLLRTEGLAVRCILTRAAEAFVTPLSVAALCEQAIYQELFDLNDEMTMGHIRLAREAEAIIVAPASADIIAKMAHGLADDLASTCLLAARCPIFVAPAMNTAMWEHPATKRNVLQLKQDGVHLIEPDAGMLACGETGSGRMCEPSAILARVLSV